MGARVAENGAFYVYSAFMLVYATQKVRMDRSIVLNGLLIASAIELVAIPCSVRSPIASGGGLYISLGP